MKSQLAELHIIFLIYDTTDMVAAIVRDSASAGSVDFGNKFVGRYKKLKCL